jgi:hypothetical protein
VVIARTRTTPRRCAYCHGELEGPGGTARRAGKTIGDAWNAIHTVVVSTCFSIAGLLVLTGLSISVAGLALALAVVARLL